jgi:hypothetical protein
LNIILRFDPCTLLVLGCSSNDTVIFVSSIISLQESANLSSFLLNCYKLQILQNTRAIFHIVFATSTCISMHILPQEPYTTNWFTMRNLGRQVRLCRRNTNMYVRQRSYKSMHSWHHSP